MYSKLPPMQTQANYEISSKNLKLNAFLHQRIINLSIDDHLDTYIDQLNVSFDNRSFSKNLFIPAPDFGKDLHLKLGYSPLLKDMGNFYIDSYSLSTPPSLLSVTAKSIDLSGKFFNQQTQIWKETDSEKKTIGSTIEEIAKKYQFAIEISQRYKTEKIQEYQYVESDIHFLSRLAKQYNAFFKVKQNKIFFIEYDELNVDELKNIEKKLKPILLPENNLSNLQLGHQEIENYKMVQTYWYDYEKAEYHLETYPSDNKNLKKVSTDNKKIFTIREIFSMQEEAQYAAKAKYRLLARNKQIINLTCLGNPELATGKQLILKNLQNEINGSWIISHINHRFDTNGYVSHVNAYRYT